MNVKLLIKRGMRKRKFCHDIFCVKVFDFNFNRYRRFLISIFNYWYRLKVYYVTNQSSKSSCKSKFPKFSQRRRKHFLEDLLHTPLTSSDDRPIRSLHFVQKIAWKVFCFHRKIWVEMKDNLTKKVIIDRYEACGNPDNTNNINLNDRSVVNP